MCFFLGFGCIGWLVVWVVFECDDIELVVINDLFIIFEYMVIYFLMLNL